MLSVVPALEKLPLLLQPINHRISVLLHAGSEHDELVPLADLAKELVAVGPFVHIVEDRVLWADYWRVGGGGQADRRIEFDFDHVARGHAAAFGEGVDEGFVEIENQGLLVARVAGVGGSGDYVGIGGLAAGDERARRCWGVGILVDLERL